jgi:hypothetical protein
MSLLPNPPHWSKPFIYNSGELVRLDNVKIRNFPCDKQIERCIMKTWGEGDEVYGSLTSILSGKGLVSFTFRLLYLQGRYPLGGLQSRFQRRV